MYAILPKLCQISFIIFYFTDYQKPVCVHAHKENILECQIALIK